MSHDILNFCLLNLTILPPGSDVFADSILFMATKLSFRLFDFGG